ncbi:hypothetical protein AAVH_38985 [Aphelenchoides avenae]|nr:hypothetical protein AAVH_38985 [Aphelenchus avenae]
MNVTLPETSGSVAAGKTLELNCAKETVAINCNGCCTVWGLRNGQINVTSRIQGTPNECYCCTKECS